jgi:hypothetical protein
MKLEIDEKSGALGITCMKCGITSWNQNDVENRYCPHCHVFGELEPDKIRDIVLVMTTKQAAALTLAATAGLFALPEIIGGFTPGKDKPPEELSNIMFPTCEAIDIINSAMGNPVHGSFHDTLRRAKDVSGYKDDDK